MACYKLVAVLVATSRRRTDERCFCVPVTWSSACRSAFVVVAHVFTWHNAVQAMDIVHPWTLDESGQPLLPITTFSIAMIHRWVNIECYIAKRCLHSARHTSVLFGKTVVDWIQVSRR